MRTNTGSPFDSGTYVTPDWEAEYQATAKQYFDHVITSPLFAAGIRRLKTIGATTGDVYELISPLNESRCPMLHRQYPGGNGPVSPREAVMSRLREWLKQ